MIANTTCALCGQDLPPSSFELCPECNEKSIKYCEEIYASQPKQKREIDQFGLTIESTISQSVFLNQSYRGNYAAFFGGYDGVGLLASNFREKGVIIIDIDTDVLDWWVKIGADNGFDVISIQYDAREPITPEMQQCISGYPIDLWRTDPPFNCSGMFCFLARIFHLNVTQVPLYLCIPEGTMWTQLLKHNVWNYVKNNGMNIASVSPSLYHYPHKEAPNSFAQRIEVEKYVPLIANAPFEYDINRPTEQFSLSPLGCKNYSICKGWRDSWDTLVSQQ